MLKDNAELDLLVMDSLGIDFRTSFEIAKELQIDENIVIEVLHFLINEHEFAIDKKGTSYKIASEDDESLEFEDE